MLWGPFYSNSFVALAFLYGARRFAIDVSGPALAVETTLFLAVGVVCLVTSRDNLRKYYERATPMLATNAWPVSGFVQPSSPSLARSKLASTVTSDGNNRRSIRRSPSRQKK